MVFLLDSISIIEITSVLLCLSLETFPQYSTLTPSLSFGVLAHLFSFRCLCLCCFTTKIRDSAAQPMIRFCVFCAPMFAYAAALPSRRVFKEERLGYLLMCGAGV